MATAPDAITVHLIKTDDDAPPVTVTIAAAQSCEHFVEYLTKKLGRKPVVINDLPLVPSVLCRSLNDGGMYVVEMAPGASVGGEPKAKPKPPIPAKTPTPPVASSLGPSAPPAPKPQPAVDPAPSSSAPPPPSAKGPAPPMSAKNRRAARKKDGIPPRPPSLVVYIDDRPPTPEIIDDSPPVSPLSFSPTAGTVLGSWGMPDGSGVPFVSLLEKSHAPLPVVSLSARHESNPPARDRLSRNDPFRPLGARSGSPMRNPFRDTESAPTRPRARSPQLVMTDEDPDRLSARKKRFAGGAPVIAKPAEPSPTPAREPEPEPAHVPAPPAEESPARQSSPPGSPVVGFQPTPIFWSDDEDTAGGKRQRTL